MGENVQHSNVLEQTECPKSHSSSRGHRGDDLRWGNPEAKSAIVGRDGRASGRARARVRARLWSRNRGRRAIRHSVGISRNLEDRAIAIFIELQNNISREHREKQCSAPTHVDKHKIGVSAVLSGTSLDLNAKGADAAHGVRRVSMVRIGRGDASDEFVQEVVDEIHLRASVSIRTVDVAIKCRVRDIICSLPYIREL